MRLTDHERVQHWREAWESIEAQLLDMQRQRDEWADKARRLERELAVWKARSLAAEEDEGEWMCTHADVCAHLAGLAKGEDA